MQGGGGGSDDDDGEFAGLGRTSSLGRTRSGPSKQQRQRQLQHQLDDLQARLNAGAYSSSAELESAILQLTKVSSGDLDWLLEELSGGAKPKLPALLVYVGCK